MRRRLALALAGVVALTAAGAVTGIWLAGRSPGAADTARAYLDALTRGDGAGAVALVSGGEAAHPQAVAAFSGARDLISEVRLGAVTESGDEADVDATARLAGTTVELPLDLQREGGTWRVNAGSLAAAELTATVGTALRVGDAVLPTGTVRLLPARYEVSGAPARLVSGTAELLVAAAPVELTVQTRLSETARDEAQRQVDAYAATCTAGADRVPDACGLRIPWAADLAAATRFAYRVERTPVVHLADDARTFVADGGVVVATVTGSTRSGQEASFTYRDDAWTLRGTVSVDAGGMTLAVR